MYCTYGKRKSEYAEPPTLEYALDSYIKEMAAEVDPNKFPNSDQPNISFVTNTLFAYYGSVISQLSLYSFKDRKIVA